MPLQPPFDAICMFYEFGVKVEKDALSAEVHFTVPPTSLAGIGGPFEK